MLLLVCLMLAFEGPKQVDLGQFDIYSPFISAAVSDNGVVCIANASDASLIFLDRDLNPIRRKTDKGQGPEELQLPMFVCWNRETLTFAVLDSSNKRLVSFDEKGFQNASRPYNLRSSSVIPGNGGTWYYTREFIDKQYLAELHHYKPDARDEDKREAVYTMDLRGVRHMTHLPFGKGRKYSLVLAWDVYLYVARGSDFLVCNGGEDGSVVVLESNGKVRTRFEASLPTRPVTRDDFERHLEDLPKKHHAGLRTHAVLPDAWPVIMGIHTDDRDRILVSGSSSQTGGSVPYQIFDVNGNLLKKGQCPGSPVGFAGNRIFWIVKNEDGDRLLGSIDFQ